MKSNVYTISISTVVVICIFYCSNYALNLQFGLHSFCRCSTVDIKGITAAQTHIFLQSVMTVESSISEQDQSMSLLSVHMGLDGVSRQSQAYQSLEDMETQEESMATGGHCITLVRLNAICVALCILEILLLGFATEMSWGFFCLNNFC